MNGLLRIVFLLFAAASLTSARAELTVHEWGTFTSVNASDGVLLSGLEREEHPLPNFVRSLTGFSPGSKGWNRPVKNVTIKMETPVLYFYSDREQPVKIEVGFHGGSISQWYPERSGGEPMPDAPHSQMSVVPPVDFTKNYAGGIRWDVTVLAPDTTEVINAPKSWETPQWPRARVRGANLVKGLPGFIETGQSDSLATAPVVEGFLFYRGIGNFELPIHLSFEGNSRLLVANRGKVPISRYWVLQRTSEPKSGVGVDQWFASAGALKPGEIGRHDIGYGGGGMTASSSTVREQDMPAALMEAGLTAKEAAAMLATWKESYFDAPGLRVFWIVPRAFTDRILPISITPAPGKLERVLVGRSEVLTPAFEKELVAGFRADGGARWTNDRYFLAYRERARQLGVVLPENTP